MLRYIFKSLYKNDVIVEERKKRPIWLALIFLFLGLGIYTIPQIVSSLNAQGAQIMTKSQNYELDKGLVLFAQDKFDAVIDEKGKLDVKDQRLLDTYTNKKPISYYVDNYMENENSKPVTATFLNVYYYEKDPLENKEAHNEFSTWINDNILVKNDKGELLTAPKSYMVLTKSYFTISVYSPISDDVNSKSVGTFTGLYDKLKRTNLKDLCATDDQGVFSQKLTYDNLVSFLNKSYESTKIKSMWLNLALTLGMNLVMVIIGSLVIFLFLRGKTSRYKGVSYYDSIKIASTMVFSPTIIATIISLFFPLYNFAFIAAYICRVMWLVTKSKNIESAAPVYKART